MPEGRASFSEHFELAIAEVRQKILSRFQTRQLSKEEIDGYRHRNFAVGWRIPAKIAIGVRQIDLLFKRSFPFTPPEVVLVNPPPPLTYPHLEEDGKLCLLSESASINYNLPVTVTEHLLQEALSLLDDCYAGNNEEDFRQEFLSYWTRAVKSRAKSFLSLIVPTPPSRLIRIWQSQDQIVIGEDDSAINAWLSNLQGKQKTLETEAAAFVWRDQPLLPGEYPKTSNDVFRLAKRASSKNVELLSQLTAKNARQAIIVFGMNSDSGPGLAGITAYEPEEKHFDKNTLHPLEKGFRAGKTPHKVLSQRFWQAATPVALSNVARADAAWIHGRGKDMRQEKLSGATAILIGCGSVGSQVAGMLAQVGIGHLILIDPQTLSWANVGRHKLGAKHVDLRKAEELAKDLRENYPHLNVEYRNESWEDILQKEPHLFANSQLIVSATGNWSSESALNVWHQDHRHQVPVIYGWTEAHACAGHAVAILSDGGCLECGMSEFGSPNLPVTDWAGATTEQREPACGAVFQPYGPIELNHTNTMIAEMALDVLLGKITQTTHHIWACKQPFLQACGGSWSNEWQTLASYQSTGGYTTTQAWCQNPQCCACSNQFNHHATLSNR